MKSKGYWLFGWVLCLLANMLVSGQGVSAAQPLRLNTGQMYLIFDPRLQGVEDNCELVVHEFKRYPGNPILKPDYPVRKGIMCGGGHVLWEEDNQLFHGHEVKKGTQLFFLTFFSKDSWGFAAAKYTSQESHDKLMAECKDLI